MALTGGRLHGPRLPLHGGTGQVTGFPGHGQAPLGHRSSWWLAWRQLAGGASGNWSGCQAAWETEAPLLRLLFPWCRRQIGFISGPRRAVEGGTVPGSLPGTHFRLHAGAMGSPGGWWSGAWPRLPPRTGAPGSGGVRRAGPRSGAQTTGGESLGAWITRGPSYLRSCAGSTFLFLWR